MQGGWSGREWPISGGVEAGKDAGLSHFELVGKDVMIKNDKKMTWHSKIVEINVFKETTYFKFLFQKCFF